ncbi:primosomal protein N' [Ruminococcaceae bacterium OttesenSCG-928-L11]|nr:primosomal protein N' [Ruminococcaceae bacterium OttesenSCG-928-L11]
MGTTPLLRRRPPPLSGEQQAALEQLQEQLSQPKPKPALLYGVTGSGKTQVFLALIESVLRKRKSVIVLVPEISLTGQTVQAFHMRFGKRVAVLHSGLSLGERMDEWKRIRAGDADIVVGTRSAVFAPVQNLGLIVLDEEQEHTYHSEKSPRYHARDVAKFRCSQTGSLLLLSSATPSVESYYYAKQGQYSLITLEERFGDAQLPDVYMVDMREAESISTSHTFSERLLQELHYNLTHGEQSILLLNRRGYSTLIKCSACGAVEECPNCSVSMTFHTANDSLVCHYCGYAKKRPAKCTECGSEMIRFSGVGTQKIQEELEALYPDARILRVDMDTTLTKFSHERLFLAFSSKEYDIMIGTQMVAKGLNFPDVTLVGVLAADQSLYAMDFRSFERSFALLTQVVGRSGRGKHRGRALIQTFSPDHPIIEQAANQDYPAFYAQEIKSRRHHLYPPFCTLAGIGFVSVSTEEIRRWPERFLEQFRKLAGEYPDLPIRVLGPVDADTYKVAGKYRRKLIIKCKNNRATRELFRRALEWFYTECKTVTAFIDMHYDRI